MYHYIISVCVCGYLGDVVEVAQDAVLPGLQAALEVSPDDGDEVNHQLQAARHQS